MDSVVSSPNSVLANALGQVEDVLTPYLRAARPKRVELCVGTQINGVPHIGTSLVQALTFALAARLRDRHQVRVQVAFTALDNAPHESVQDPASGHIYQRALAHAFDPATVGRQIDSLYQPLFDALSSRAAVSYRLETYTQQQAGPGFRMTWLRLLPRMEAARWWLAPPTGTPHLRVPCPAAGCGWAEKHAERTTVRPGPDQTATVVAVCLQHGPYDAVISAGGGGYLDLSTLYRNVVKELAVQLTPDTLTVMIKGADWMPGTLLVNGALTAVGLTPGQIPARIFCPQIVTATGAKLSKSLIRDGRAEPMDLGDEWMLDTRKWPGSPDSYAARLLDTATVLLSHPRHFFRDYSAQEIARLMETRSVHAR
ncbi:hypothetical protein [Streptomyces sp. NPDC048357]|uniref:hypothetical protein n=1 Tax=Streptomyces sp. NPDC048357 TaxID=3154719 RepID=UPI003441320B